MGYETKSLKMKKFILPGILSFIGISAIAQIDNGDFETWNSMNLFDHPETGIATNSSNYETFFDNGEINVYQIEHDNGSAMRIESIQGSQDVMPGYFLFGNTPDSDGGAMIFGDGFAVSDASVTGVRMDLNYNFPNEANGFVVVQFKSEGMPVGTGNLAPGTYYFPISGTQEWTTTDFEFEAPVESTIDQCVIGIASADLIAEDSPFGVGAFIEVDNIELINSSDVVPGGTFDTWTEVDPLIYPANVEVDVRPFNMTYERSENSYEGQYALGLHSIERYGEVEVGEAIMGTVENNDIVPTIEIGEESMISFMYNYTANADMGEARMIFYQQSGEEFIPVYSESIDLAVTDGYEMMEFDFGSMLSENIVEASHMAVIFSSSKMEDNTPEDGSVLLIDNVQLGSALGIFHSYRTRIQTITAYPNPTIGRIIFDFNAPRSGFYRVYNGQGIQIAIVQYSNKDRVVFNLAGYAAGKYFFNFIHTNGESEAVRVMKQ